MRLLMTAALVVLGLVAVGLLVVLLLQKRRARDAGERVPAGRYLSMGLGIGMAFGAAMGLVFGQIMGDRKLGIALGPGIGLSIGVAVGLALEQFHKTETRPLTPEEKRTRRSATLIGLAALVIGVLAFSFVAWAR